MNVYRAITSCPVCREEQEAWNYKGIFLPNNLTQCYGCDSVFETDSYINAFLSLRSNTTVSTAHIRSLLNF